MVRCQGMGTASGCYCLPGLAELLSDESRMFLLRSLFATKAFNEGSVDVYYAKP